LNSKKFFAKIQAREKGKTKMMRKKALFIIAFNDFRDEEYFIPKEILEQAGIEVKTASTQKGTASGKLGGKTEVDLVLDEVEVGDYEAIIFVGGPGVYNYLEDPAFHKIAQEGYLCEKIIGAICIAPVILAKAGILKGKKATVWNSPDYKESIKELEKGGAEFVEKEVVVDGNIITACGPEAAKEFGEEILKKLRV